jgi:Domain of unknown function (DUF3883)
MDLTVRDKTIICGLFLSKFDSKGLTALGFNTFKEAFNVLGLAINAKSASIKNYRDELDPLFPNTRLGWHKRKLREHCQKIYETYQSYDLEEMATLVASITGCDLTQDQDDIVTCEAESFAKRLATGRAAENFFLSNYRAEPDFASLDVVDVTQTGCGFDFRLQHESKMSFNAVEVKGVRLNNGSITLTNKEHAVAGFLGEQYYLYVVKNFDDVPYAINYCDPLRAGLRFSRKERTVIQISWSTKL